MLSHITKTIRVNIKENHLNLLSKEVALAVIEIALIGIFIHEMLFTISLCKHTQSAIECSFEHCWSERTGTPVCFEHTRQI